MLSTSVKRKASVSFGGQAWQADRGRCKHLHAYCIPQMRRPHIPALSRVGFWKPPRPVGAGVGLMWGREACLALPGATRYGWDDDFPKNLPLKDIPASPAPTI